jgi:microcin C transport system substrate-binding protein
LILRILLLPTLLFSDYSFSLLGEPKYSESSSFEYANKKAPKGGDIKLGVGGTFDSLNPFILKGNSADGIDLIYDSLVSKSSDEVASYYGLLAKDTNISEDWKSVIFTISEDAKFSDGKSVLATDIKFTFKTLLEKGSPIYKAHLKGIENIEILNERKIKFTLSEDSSRDLIATIGEMLIFPKSDNWGDGIPIGSGAYKIEKFESGKFVKFQRREDYWGENILPNRGKNNFNSITYEYYRDENVLFEAFKSLNYHFRLENMSKNWATAYDDLDERFVVEEIKNRVPQGMQGYFFNTRLLKFSDWRIRRGIALAFDFEWANKNLFYGQYTRSNSFFANSIFDSEKFKMPIAGGSYEIRPSLRSAMRSLRSAGCYLKNGKLYFKSGDRVKFEILLYSQGFVRITLPFKRNLAKLGIDVEIKVIDISQYIERVKKHDFEMIVSSRSEPILIGGEQFSFWHSSLANVEGSQNIAGVNNKIVDSLIGNIKSAKNLEELKKSVFLLDKELLTNFYVIPQWHIDKFRVAYWNRIHRPKKSPSYDLGFNYWWYE